MPLNCPICYPYECDGCRYLWDDRCNYYTPARPLAEILTPNERMRLLEKQPQPESIGYGKLKDELEQAKGQMMWLTRKLNEHLDKKKKKEAHLYE